MSEICYAKPFLSEVIARVDFAAPLAGLVGSIPGPVVKAALDRFPIPEPRQTVTKEVTLEGKDVQQKETRFTEWNYWGREREKRLAISQSAVFEAISRYDSFAQMTMDFQPVLQAIRAEFPDAVASRVGLRYVNLVEPRLDSPLKWNEHISENLLCAMDRFSTGEGVLSRALTIVGLKYSGNIDLKFMYGVANPDYPAAIRRPQFVLDLDAYVTGLQELSDVPGILLQAHGHIQDQFESSITNTLRELMDARPRQS